jgi:hypothetical protein
MKLFSVMFMTAILTGCNSPSRPDARTTLAPHCPEGQKPYGGQPLEIGAPAFSGDESRLISVEVRGEVVHPRNYALPAGSGVSDAVRQAGGFTEYGLQRDISVDRFGGVNHCGKTFAVDFRKVRKNWRYDLILQDGDKIYVPRGDFGIR